MSETRTRKILEMLDLLVGTFDTMIENIAIQGLGDVEPSMIPEPIKKTHDIIKAALSAKRTEHEAAVVAIIEKYFTEEDVDVILAFNKSETGKKMRTVNVKLTEDLDEAMANWRNASLEPHLKEIEATLGVVTPEPAVDLDAPNGTSNETPTAA